MAYFKYLGEPPRPSLVVSYGPTLRLSIPKADGNSTTLDAPPGGFPIGGQIDFDFTDSYSLYFLRGDPRFQEVK